MQVKKFVSESIGEALKQIKNELGPEAIVLSTKEEKRVYGKAPQFTVVAAISENQLRKKEITEKKLGHLVDSFQNRTATKQKAIIDGVVRDIEDKYNIKNIEFTKTRYIDIEGDEAVENSSSQPVSGAKAASVDHSANIGKVRVKSAVREALSSGFSSHFFGVKAEPPFPAPIERQMSPEPPRVAAMPRIESRSQGWPEVFEPMLQKLKSSGMSEKLIENYLGGARQISGASLNRATIEAFVAKKILKETRCVSQGAKGGIEFFVGPQGVGKTTSLVKLAGEYIVNHRRNVAIVTTDSSKVGAFAQLKVFSRILNIPVYSAGSISEWQERMEELEGFDSVLVDTAGVKLSDPSDFDFLRNLVRNHGRMQAVTHLVLSATAPSADSARIAKQFRCADYSDVIFNKIDQTSQHGVLLNFQQQWNIPFHSFGLGPDIIDGFEWATRERVLDLIFKLTKINGVKNYGQVL